ncbi:MAG: hypothetical protein M3Y04_09085, partial [Actinomycetota bacterium]|nr:hypothetical protein [Actinomycetota bacterium]
PAVAPTASQLSLGPADSTPARCTLRCMHRTNIYLSDDQDRVFRARACAEGTTKSEEIRKVLDRDIKVIEDDVVAGFAELVDRYDELVEGLFDDDPDLRLRR